MMRWMHYAADERFATVDQQIPPLGAAISPRACMQLALDVALKGAGRVHSNPMVGAVAVDQSHRFLGWGAHLGFGGPHAEAHLLTALGQQGLVERLATIYCTLEPCSHQGKTPACAVALAKACTANLVYGCIDPNPRVKGQGIAHLTQAGWKCHTDPWFATQAQDLIAEFSYHQRTGLPFVAAKIATSLDSGIGLAGQGRVPVTGLRARHYGHWLRHRYDGIVVGAGTVIADNPSLSIRHPRIPTPAPLVRIVLDPKARAFRARPITTQNLVKNRSTSDQLVWVVSRRLPPKTQAAMAAELTSLGGELLALEEANGFNLKLLLEALAKRGVASLLLEGGAQVWQYFFCLNLVQQLHYFQAPTLWGCDQGLSWHTGLQLPHRLELQDPRILPLESDWVIEGRVQAREDLDGAPASEF